VNWRDRSGNSWFTQLFEYIWQESRGERVGDGRDLKYLNAAGWIQRKRFGYTKGYTQWRDEPEVGGRTPHPWWRRN
jgi:hypothetical protein